MGTDGTIGEGMSGQERGDVAAVRRQHAAALIQQATALEVAAALYCVAQAIQDSSGQ